MESLASSSSPPDHQHHRFEPTQPLAERIIRALPRHLRLLHRSDSNFFVLGATGNVYTVNLSATPTCTCPDRTTPCKHILFVFIRVLGVSLDDSCLRRRTLRPCQLNRLLSSPTLTDALARGTVRQMFHRLFFHARPSMSSPHVDIEDGTNCPVCLEEMGKGEKIVACRTCRNSIHEECLMAWKKISRKRSASCVLCRARWRNTADDQDKYLNLSAYISGDDMVEGVGRCS